MKTKAHHLSAWTPLCWALISVVYLGFTARALAQHGWVLSHQKISDTEGSFTGMLDDSDAFGGSVASVGDLDGDGLADLAVGAWSDDDGGVNHGAVWVLFLGIGCEGFDVESLLASSGELSPFDSGFPQDHEFTDLPEPFGDVLLTFTIRGDFDGMTELASIELNGTPIGVLLADDGEEFPETPQAREILITLADFVELVPDGIATVAMVPSDAVSAACGELESFISVELTYQYISIVNDCNDNGTRDECDIVGGSSLDCNGNEIPDECDIADGTSQDDNGNDVPDECEACEGDANGDGLVDPLDSGFVLPRFGCPVGTGDDGCDTADMNGDGLVDPLDVGFVLARFGPCP